MKTRNIAAAVLGLALALGLAAPAALAQTAAAVAGAGAAALPTGSAYSGVPLTGLRFAIGVDISSGTATGDFQATLLGTVAGQARNIVVEGKAALGSLPAANTATFSGVSTVNMGDGTPALVAVPFVVTVVSTPDGKGTLALSLATTSLPAGTVNAGGFSIK